MALAPGLKRRGGLFGSSPMQPPYATPGIGDGMTAARQPMAPAKPKFFGEGGVGRAIAGNIGDFLLQYSGMNPIYQPAMQQRQAMAYDQQQRETQRRQGLEDWMARQEWERANPSPRAPHYWETNDGSLGMVGPDGKPSILYQDPNDKIQWMQVDNGDGTKTVVPYNSKGPLGQQPQAPSQAQGAPQRPVGKLKPYGGPSATPTGGFR